MQKSKVLLIGNGPSATSLKVGDKIDNFDGKIVRFNSFITEGFEEFVGTRTDFWVTCQAFVRWFKDYEKVLYCCYHRVPDEPGLLRLRQRYPDCDHIPEDTWTEIMSFFKQIGPSSGAVATTYFIHDYEVYIYGFDFFCGNKHHYSDNINACWHKADIEKQYFGKLLRAGKIKPFEEYLRKFNYNIFEAGCSNEKDKYDWIYAGGCPGYGGRNHGYNTYSLIEKVRPKTLLDVGCGKGYYVEWCKRHNIDAVGVDFASGYGVRADVCKLPFDTNSFEIVTAFDLLEHIPIEKLDTAISELKRVAQDLVIVSIGYGSSRIKTPDTSCELHCIKDKDEQWWFDKLSEFGIVSKYSKDFYNHPFFVVRKEQ